MTTRPVTVLAMAPGVVDRLFTPASLSRLGSIATVDPSLVVRDFRAPEALGPLRHAEVLLTSWGCRPIDAAVLADAPELRAIVHAAGSVKAHVKPACFERGILVSTAATANALPVAEYTLAMILLANKRVLDMSAIYHQRRARVHLQDEFSDVGNYERTIGIVGASRVGRRVIDLLRLFDFEVLLADPYILAGEAAELGAKLVELDDLVSRCDVVSLHAPALPSTRHLIDRRRMSLMRDGAILINTARGWLVDQEALISELSGSRIRAVIDVTEPEVLPPDSPLYDLPGLVLTPHVAGAVGREVRRLAEAAISEIERYAQGQPMEHLVRLADFERIA